MRIGGLGISQSSSCYDPNHPWWLPNGFATAYECECLWNAGDHSPCSPWPGGTPTDYQGTDTSVAENIGYGAGVVAGDVTSGAAGAIGQAASAAVDNLNLGGALMLAGLVLAGVVIVPELLRR